jgi:hypothetical protein
MRTNWKLLTREEFALCIAAFILAPCVNVAAHADQATQQRRAQMQDALVHSEQVNIASPYLHVREEAFDRITKPLRGDNGLGPIDPTLATDATKKAVTALFRAELPGSPVHDDVTSNESDDELGEDLSGYLSGLIEAVGQLHDPGAIPLLYTPYVLGTGEMASNALAYFGHTEAPRVIALFQKERPGVYRVSLETVLYGMLAQHTLDKPELRDEVEQLFLRQTYSANAGENGMGITGLSFFSDAVARNRLADLAEHDSDVTTVSGIKRSSHIRQEAALALQGPMYKSP